VGKPQVKWVHAWSDAYLMLLQNSGVQPVLQAGSFFSQCSILLFQLLHSPSQMSMVPLQLIHPPSQGRFLPLQGLHLPIQTIMLALHYLQPPLQVLHLHKRDGPLSMCVKLLLDPRHVLAKLQLTAGHNGAK